MLGLEEVTQKQIEIIGHTAECINKPEKHLNLNNFT